MLVDWSSRYLCKQDGKIYLSERCMASAKSLQAIVDIFDDHRMLYGHDFFARHSVNWC